MKGRHVLLTGGTGGLGLGVTPEVLRRGVASLTIPYHNAQDVERLKQQLSAAEADQIRADQIRFVSADLTHESTVQSLIAAMEQVDVLIHLVGGFSMGTTHDYSYAQWKKDFDLNLNSTFLVCKYSLASMLKHGYGRIVTIGSRGVEQPGGKLASYCASKAGVVALTRSIADETKGTNITANSVLPSVIDTPSNRDAMGTDQADQWVKPTSLAQTICFLASEAAIDLRGAAVPVYGNA